MNVPVPVNGSMMWTSFSPRPLSNSSRRTSSTLWMMKSTTSIGRVDDAQPLGHAAEGILEELFVQLHDDRLAGLGVVDAFGTVADARRRTFRASSVSLSMACFVEHVEHLLHGLANGVLLGEGVVGEERVEDRPGDQVLREHLDRVVRGDGGVEVVLQALEELVERLGLLRCRLVEERLDAGDVPLGDLRDVAGPSLPIGAVATPSGPSWRRWRLSTRRGCGKAKTP